MDNKIKLRNAGLRPTKQRIIIADILLNGFNRHFTAENLQNEISISGNKMSIALVVTKVDAIMKKINNRNTISVIDDMLNSGVILFRPLRFILYRFVE